MPRPISVVALLALGLVPAARAQTRDVEAHYGRWYGGNDATTYEVRSSQPWFGALTHGPVAAVVLNDSLGRRRAFYGLGYELQAFRRRTALGPYALVGLLMGLSTDTTTQEIAAQWNVGGGVEWRPIDRFAIGAEARYRLEDRGPHGFWHPRSDARRGISFSAGVTIGLGRGGGSGGSRTASRSVPLAAPATIGGSAADVVHTALDALGTPYQWGGTAANGFDCSGLIQYAYGQHGVRLPRTSRDQAGVGSTITPVVEALQPGDILLFSATPGAGV
ncbi:MAG TPA: NlpC/P60 family protein, partial [Gemmatimonadales bacterium]|nr:NlpC/P60 family protein [Gemmatimonadales bacterium]